MRASILRRNPPGLLAPSSGMTSSFTRLTLIGGLILWLSWWNQTSFMMESNTSRHSQDEMLTMIPCEDLVPDWIWNLFASVERKVYSQYGEDGITEYLLKYLPGPPIPKYYVEFGVENGTECNTRILREQLNWTKGLLMDGSHNNKNIGLYQHWIHPSTIVSLFEKYNVPKQFGVFSEDTDYADYYMWQSILEAGYRPRILISEVNSNFLPNEAATVLPPNSSQNIALGRNNYYGVSPLALRHLWNQHGYIMVYCTQQQVNCFGVKAEDVIIPIQKNHKNQQQHQGLTLLQQQAQQCLWEKPIVWFYERHGCEMDPNSIYRKVDRFGRVLEEEYYIPWFVEGCTNNLGPWKKRPIQFNVIAPKINK